MPALINSYTTDVPAIHRSCEYSTVSRTRVIERPLRLTSISIKEKRSRITLNSRTIGLLAEIGMLKDNWDEDGALAPSIEVLRRASFMVGYLDGTGQKVYNVAPGPKGEIMVDIRNGDKSLELLFYSDKTKYVKFNGNEKPEQGLFENELLPQLMSWLNDTNIG